MMGSRNFILISGFVAFSFVGLTWNSCKEESRANVLELEVMNKNNPIKVEIYDLVDSIQYTALETSDSCVLGEIIHVKKADGHYFVRDNRGLYVFDDKGKFINKISQKGNGHEEYVYLDNFYIDKERNLVGLVCSYSNKIMFFSYNGKFHSTVYMKEDCGMFSIMQCPGQELLAYYPMPNDFSPVSFEYKKARIHGDSLEAQPLVPMKELTTKDVYYAFFSQPMAVYKEACLFLSVLSHNLYVCQQGEVKRTYQFDLSKEIPGDREQEGYKNKNFYELRSEIKASGKSIGLTGIQANGDYVLISVNNENVLIWDGNRSVLIQQIYDSGLNLYHSDIVLSGGCSDENIGFYPADFLCGMKDSASWRDGTLRQIVDAIKEDDNPVLYQFVFKKDLINQLNEKYGLQ